jgi:hypothetical protein
MSPSFFLLGNAPQQPKDKWQQEEQYPQMCHDPAGNVSGVR